MEATTMEYAYIQLHAPEPPQPRDEKSDRREQDNPYPDYEQSLIYEEECPARRVVVIDL